MRVAEIQVVRVDEQCQLQGWVESDRNAHDGNRFAPFWLWYRFPLWCEPFLTPENGMPFLAALLAPAMLTGERLAIAGSISPRLARRLDDIQAIYASFEPRWQRVDVQTAAPATSPPPAANPAQGVFLSLGVDSFYSLLKNLETHPADDESVSHLLTVHGFDMAYDAWDERFPAKFLENCERVARETGKTLIPVTTNVRWITRPISGWEMSHGGALASVALALDAFLSQIRIAASTTYDKLYPWGSHPVLDPLWSTERLEVIHDGCEIGRVDKMRFVARSQLVLETLKVCPAYNCGGCIKCLPAIIDLMQAGLLDRCTTLPHELDVARAQVVFRAYQGRLSTENYARRLANMAEGDGPPGLRDTLQELLDGADSPAPRQHFAGSTNRSPVGRLVSRFIR